MGLHGVALSVNMTKNTNHARIRILLIAIFIGGVLTAIVYFLSAVSQPLGLAIGFGLSAFLGIIFCWHWKEVLWRKLDIEDPRVDQVRALIQLGTDGFSSTLPWSPWALFPVDLLDILTTIESTDAETIVECGSGISTVYIARTLRSRGNGHLFSLEHDERWADLVSGLLRRSGLTEFATIVAAPLCDIEVEGRNMQWYELPDGFLHELPSIDVLLVDGPPGYIAPEIRFPALPILWDHLSSDATIFLDDAHRDEEQRILGHWLKRFPCSRQPQERGANSVKLNRMQGDPNQHP